MPDSSLLGIENNYKHISCETYTKMDQENITVI